MSGVFKSTKSIGERDVDVNDFYMLDNGNIGIIIELPVIELQTTGRYESKSFKIGIEYVHDYPIAPPKVFIIDPELDPIETPHMYVDGSICYLKADEDWSNDYTSYEVALMAKSWIYAYCKWERKGIWKKKTPRKHIWIVEFVIEFFREIFKRKQVCWPTLPEVDDNAVVPTLPHVEDVVQKRFTKDINRCAGIFIY